MQSFNRGETYSLLAIFSGSRSKMTSLARTRKLKVLFVTGLGEFGGRPSSWLVALGCTDPETTPVDGYNNDRGSSMFSPQGRCEITSLDYCKVDAIYKPDVLFSLADVQSGQCI